LLHLPLLLPLLAKYTSRKFTHFIALVCGGLGLISIYFIQEPTAFTMEWLPMIGVGIAWASILVLYVMVHYLLTKWAITWSF
jgi:maltose/moltooligosaccharide transporter